MEKQYLMHINSVLTYSSVEKNEPTFMSPKLRSKFIQAAIRYACDFYSDFFGEGVNIGQDLDNEKLYIEYNKIYSHALSLGLFQPGGISEKDHLNFWCLANIFSPEMYIESGVFIGSSLHAFINSLNPDLKKIIAIDPNLSNLKVSTKNSLDMLLVDDKDFYQIDIDTTSFYKTLVFFDDHINSAERILQAYEKGLAYLLFDDSTGLEGICQRFYPAIPTVPMIINCHLLSPGEELCWTLKKNSDTGVRISLTINQELIDKCYQAKSLIKKCSKIPELGDFIPQPYPGKTVNSSKYLIELKQSSS
ncbi:hypothetical protein [Geitlerinema sp. PCC 9228]|uniref:hypothetical protein n=1 Tax=Geitlerinema sp. PCC 9228 TaxID=111611 RepID=UPI001114D9E1|nr:hypothetical protein [Geitlerinema sp. PCC 9228]